MSDHLIQPKKLKNKFSPEYPIMLFPLRVETRFIKTQQNHNDGTPINPIVGVTTTMAEMLTSLGSGEDVLDMRKLEQIIGSIQKHFISVQHEQNSSNSADTSATANSTSSVILSPIARWKLTMFDALLKIHGSNLIINYRKAWSALLLDNQTASELIQQTNDLAFELDDSVPPLDDILHGFITAKVTELNKQLQTANKLDKFTAQGLAIQQKRITNSLKELYDVIVSLQSLNADALEFIQGVIETINISNEWNEQALVYITQVDSHINAQEESIQEIEQYFSAQHEQNIQSDIFGAYALNWTRIITIKERLRLFHQAQKSNKFRTASEHLKKLENSFIELVDSTNIENSVGEYTQAEISLFEHLLEFNKTTFDEKWDVYRNQIDAFQSQIVEAYDYFQDISSDTDLRQEGSVNIKVFLELVDALQRIIYKHIATTDYDLNQILDDIPTILNLFFKLTPTIIEIKIEGDEESEIFEETLNTLQQTYDDLNTFIEDEILSFKSQQKILIEQLKDGLKTVKDIQKDTFQKIPYITYWKELQDNLLIIESADYQNLAYTLSLLAETYSSTNINLAENQHFVTAEVIGRNQGLIDASSVLQQKLITPISQWIVQLDELVSQLDTLIWIKNDNLPDLPITNKATFDYLTNQVDILTDKEDEAPEISIKRSKRIFEVAKELYNLLKKIEEAPSKDVKDFEKMVKNVTKKIEKWSKELGKTIKDVEKKHSKSLDEQGDMIKHIQTIRTELLSNDLYALWMYQHELGEYNKRLMKESSIDAPFQLNIITKNQIVFQSILELQQNINASSLEYNHQVFKSVTEANNSLNNYLQEYQKYYKTIIALVNRIIDAQTTTDEFLSERVTDLVDVSDVEGEGKVIEFINQAKLLLANFSTIEQTPSILLSSLKELRQLFEQIQLHIQLIDTIPKELSTLPNQINSLKENFKLWHQAFMESISSTLEELKAGELIIKALKAESVRMGIPPSDPTIAAKQGEINITSSLPPIVCEFPLPGGGTPPGGGGTPGGTPDPVILQEHELWIRVYPDYATINSHDKRLTETEVQAGINFWIEYWFAYGNRTLEVGAWRALVEKFGSQRAAWIIKKLRPKNLSSKPKLTVSITDILYKFNQQLSEEDIKVGVNYWNSAVFSKNVDELQILKNSFEKSYPNGQAALLANLTRLPQVSKAFNPSYSGGDSTEGVIQLNTKVINAVLTKSSNIQVNQIIPVVPAILPQFPVIAPSDIKSKAWDSAPYTNMLPDQLVFTIYDNAGNLKYEEEGKLIPDKLKTGPDPNNLENYDPSQPDLGVDGDIKWMTDFQEAVDNGMAIRIAIRNEEGSPDSLEAGFSKIFVLGVKHFDKENPTDNNIDTFQNDSVLLLEELLESQHYIHTGMGVLRPGTATNNTSDGQSPFKEDSVDETFDREVVGLLSSPMLPDSNADGHLLSKVLGINTNTFRYIENANEESIANAENINRSLWTTTWGYYLEELDNNIRILHNEKTPIIPQNIIDTLKEEFFIPSVKGRGALPGIRIGKQPYGILPTSSFESASSTAGGWAWDDILSDVDKSNFYNSLTTILLEHLWGYRNFDSSINTSKKWKTIAEEQIYTVDDPVEDGNSLFNFADGLTATQERFMEILRLHPRSIEFFNRYGMTIESGSNLSSYSSVAAFNSFLEFNRTFGDEFEQYYLDNSANPTQVSLAHSLLANIRLLNPIDTNGNIESLAPLNGPIVDDKLKASEKRTLSAINSSGVNYIEWLIQTDPMTIYTASKQHTEPSKSLLYHSLKNALFNQYWDACARILEDTKLIPGNQTRFKDLMFRHHPSSPSNPIVNYVVELNDDRPIPTTQTIHREFFRERYRDFVIDVTDDIKGGIPIDPEFGDQLIFANGRWPIMTMTILNGELKNLTSDAQLINLVHQGVNNPQSFVRVEFPEAMEGLLKFRASLNHLAQLSTAELERLFSEHMDLASHRLDAWILGFVNQRLTQMREIKPNGIYLGAYGWLLNLKPGSQRQELYGSSTYHVKVGGVIPEMIDPDNQGHIIGPSINHATTAAVLKSGYNAHLGGAEAGALAINLSSKRIRKALFYLDGIRNGQPLSALLGYQLERDLVNNGLGQYIQALRAAFPLNKIPNLLPSDPTDLHNTIDGQALIDAVRIQTYPLSIIPLFSSSSATAEPLLTQIDKLFDAIDALGDLAIAEGTYHVVSGNYARAGAMLKALSQQNYIPEPEVIQTPRTGRTLTHRVGMVFPALASNTPLWTSQHSSRSIAEPNLNAWLAQELPNPLNIQCQIFYKAVAGGVTGGSMVLNLTDLGIEPIDLFYMFPDDVNEADNVLAKLYKQAAVNILYTNNPNTIFNKFIVDFVGRDSTWGEEILTIEEIANLIYPMRQMVLKARPMTAVDIIHPSTLASNIGDEFNINIAEVQQRTQQLEAIIIAHKNQLQNDFQSLWLTTLDAVNNADIEIPEEPLLLVDYSEQFDRIEKTLNRRLADYQTILTKINPTLNSKKQFILYEEAAQALLGKSFRLFPSFLAHNMAELQNCYNDSSAILPNAQPLELEGWVMGLSRVREAIDDLEQISLMQSILEGEESLGLTLSPLQLPYRENDHWVGLGLPPNYYPNHQNDIEFVSLDKLSLVFELPTNFSALTSYVGMIVDEWTELIPHSEETIGVAFHYDEPNAEPPQAILLAIHPKTIKAKDLALGINWNWSQLINTLDSTLELAKIRAVEPDQLQSMEGTIGGTFNAYSQAIPATFMRLQENNLDGDWYTDYGLNTDNPLYAPVPITDPDPDPDIDIDPNLDDA